MFILVCFLPWRLIVEMNQWQQSALSPTSLFRSKATCSLLGKAVKTCMYSHQLGAGCISLALTDTFHQASAGTAHCCCALMQMHRFKQSCCSFCLSSSADSPLWVISISNCKQGTRTHAHTRVHTHTHPSRLSPQFLLLRQCTHTHAHKKLDLRMRAHTFAAAHAVCVQLSLEPLVYPAL